MKTVLFQKLVSEDFEEYYRLVSDEQVMAQITERAIPRTEAMENYQKLLARNEQTSFGSYKVLDNESKAVVGSAHLTPREAGEAELGYMFLPEYWHQGYGKAVMKKLLELAAVSDFSLLYGIIDPENYASKRLLEANGFKTDFLGVMDGLPTEILKKKLN